MIDQKEIVLKVAKDTVVEHLATSVVKYIEEGYRVVMACIGCMPIMQATKAIAVANSRTGPHGFFLSMLPAFQVVHFPDKETREIVERTAMRFTVIMRSFSE